MDISVLISKLSINELNDLKIIIEKCISEKQTIKTSLDYNIVNIRLTGRAYHCLMLLVITNLKELSQKKPSDFSQYRNIGEKTIKELTDILTDHGLSWSS